MKRYPKYKDSGIEWIGEIPEHWIVTCLKRICLKITDGSHFSPETKDIGFPYITVQDIKDNGIDFKNCKYISGEDYLSLKKGGCQPDKFDILLTKDGTIGKAVVIKQNRDFVILSSLGLITPNLSRIISDYLRYYLISGINIDQMFSFIRGSALTRLTINLIKQLHVVYPPLPEQQSITNYLDRKTHLIDTLIEKKQKLIDLLKEQRAAIINQAVTKGLNPNVKLKDSGIEWLGEIPEHWIVAGMTKYIKSIVDYRGRTPEKIEVGVFLVTARNIKEGKIDYSLSQEYISQSEYERIMTRGIPQIGDVLFTTEAPLGEVANVDDENIALAQRIIKFRGNTDYLDDYFLKYWILSEAFQNDLQSYATGSTALGIKASKLNFLRIALPPLTEQEKIVSYLDDISFEFVQLIDKHNKSIDHLKEYRTALISEVVTGKIDVRDSEKQEVRPS